MFLGGATIFPIGDPTQAANTVQLQPDTPESYTRWVMVLDGRASISKPHLLQRSGQVKEDQLFVSCVWSWWLQRSRCSINQPVAQTNRCNHRSLTNRKRSKCNRALSRHFLNNLNQSRKLWHRSRNNNHQVASMTSCVPLESLKETGRPLTT